MIHARDLLGAMRKAGPLGFIAVTVFMGVIYFGIPMNKTNAAEVVMRETFHVPETANFIDIDRPRAYRPGIVVEGTVQLTPQAYSSYRAAALDPAQWTPLRLSRNSINIDQTDNSELQSWRSIVRSIPKSEGWDHVLQKPVYYDELGHVSTETGLVLCFVVRQKSGVPNKDKSTWRAENFEVASCKSVVIEQRPSALVFGVLDDQTHTLYIKVRHAGFWPE